jgi:prepilin-type N-terminal cleavage/methylation domain-containing protein
MIKVRNSKQPKEPRFAALAPSDFEFVSGFGFRVSNLSCSSAFTLIEMLLALAVSAIVLAGIGGVFYSAIRLRERTAALVDESVPLYQSLSFLRRDLQGTVGPGGVLAGDFRSGAVNSGTLQGYGLQFCTTTGNLKDEVPWGDIQEVTYELRDPTERNNLGGKDLIRSVTRNLLSTTTQESDDQWLMGNVKSLEFACFDGTDWRDTWDTSIGNTNLPVAVRVRIQLATDNTYDSRSRQPIEMVVPLATQFRTNALQNAEVLP